MKNWIVHEGTENPIPDAEPETFWLLFNDDIESFSYWPSSEWYWGKETILEPYRIVAYALVEAPENFNDEEPKGGIVVFV